LRNRNQIREQAQQQQKVAILNEAIGLDTLALADRYGNDLVQDFVKDFQLGKIKMDDDMAKVDNALEALFLEWVDRPSVMNKLTPHDLEKIITATNEKPVRSRSVDALIPQRVRPKPKPKAEKTHRVLELSSQDVQEALGDWLKKHPERFR
jgi:hypothetical protein